MRILVTGSSGFIGKNLVIHLSEQADFSVLIFSRENDLDELQGLVDQADAVVHLAGVNRPKDISEFYEVNVGLTQSICDAVRATGRKIPLIFASSTWANYLDNPYGKSKRDAELAIELLSKEVGNSVSIYRFPGIFGKWCKPNYNSVVATFCYNIANDLPIQMNNQSTELKLNYIDDVIADFIATLQGVDEGLSYPLVEPEYKVSLGELADQIKAYKRSRTSLLSEPVGAGFVRALYSTYVSYLKPDQFSYSLVQHADDRGIFVEMLKTKETGQFSYFTANPGITRGGHFHHTKTEKFLVIKGTAKFGFRDIVTDERFEIVTSGDEPHVVDTVPGWAHEITNIGDDEMLVMLWANEIFDREHPDTMVAKV